MKRNRALFGNLDDFDELIAQAHQRDIKIIIDQVLSHTSDQHQWFIDSREDLTNDKADWYVWADAKEDGTAQFYTWYRSREHQT